MGSSFVRGGVVRSLLRDVTDFVLLFGAGCGLVGVLMFDRLRGRR